MSFNVIKENLGRTLIYWSNAYNESREPAAHRAAEPLKRGDGGSRTLVRKASIVGTTCLVCHLFNLLKLRQTGFS